MDLATHVSKAPWSTKEEVVNAFREESEHQQEVGDGQVHHQEVSRSTKRWEAAEDLQDDGISKDGGDTNDQVEQSQEVIPGRVEGLERVPVRMKEAADIFRSVGIDRECIRQSPWIKSLLLGHSHHSITSQVCHLFELQRKI